MATTFLIWQSLWFSLMFIGYICVTVFMLKSVLVAVIFENYRTFHGQVSAHDCAIITSR